LSLITRLWGRISLIILPFASCLDVRSVATDELTPRAGEVLHVNINFDPPTTEGLEAGMQIYGFLAIELPEDWSYVEGAWQIEGSLGGDAVEMQAKPGKLTAEAGYRWMALTSSEPVSIADLTGTVHAQITLKTTFTSGEYSLIFIGGAYLSRSDITLSGVAPYRIMVKTL